MIPRRSLLLTVVSRILWKFPSGEDKRHRLEGLGQGPPSIKLPHLALPGANSAQGSIGTVSAHGSTVWILMRCRNSSFSR